MNIKTFECLFNNIVYFNKTTPLTILILLRFLKILLKFEYHLNILISFDSQTLLKKHHVLLASKKNNVKRHKVH